MIRTLSIFDPLVEMCASSFEADDFVSHLDVQRRFIQRSGIESKAVMIDDREALLIAPFNPGDLEEPMQELPWSQCLLNTTSWNLLLSPGAMNQLMRSYQEVPLVLDEFEWAGDPLPGFFAQDAYHLNLSDYRQAEDWQHSLRSKDRKTFKAVARKVEPQYKILLREPPTGAEIEYLRVWYCEQMSQLNGYTSETPPYFPALFQEFVDWPDGLWLLARDLQGKLKAAIICTPVHRLKKLRLIAVIREPGLRDVVIHLVRAAVEMAVQEGFSVFDFADAASQGVNVHDYKRQFFPPGGESYQRAYSILMLPTTEYKKELSKAWHEELYPPFWIDGELLSI